MYFHKFTLVLILDSKISRRKRFNITWINIWLIVLPTKKLVFQEERPHTLIMLMCEIKAIFRQIESCILRQIFLFCLSSYGILCHQVFLTACMFHRMDAHCCLPPDQKQGAFHLASLESTPKCPFFMVYSCVSPWSRSQDWSIRVCYGLVYVVCLHCVPRDTATNPLTSLRE